MGKLKKNKKDKKYQLANEVARLVMEKLEQKRRRSQSNDSSSTDDDKNDNGNQGRVASKVVQVHNTTGHTDATAQVTSPTQGSSLNNVKTPETDSNVTEKTLNDDVLNKIDKRLIEDRTFPELIHSVFTERWTDFIKVGLPKEERKELIKKFPLPKNCTFLDPPKIN
ncbi:hypothetical protein TKK_0000425 [Trichogramma kaykai]